MFKALSSESRIRILKKLAQKEFHISQLSRELKISKPVISRHIKILEVAGLVKRRVIGNVHLLSCNIESLENAYEPFVEESNIKIEKNSTIFDVIKQLPGIETVTHGKNKYIASIGGEKGYYIYEVNGKAPEKPIDKYILKLIDSYKISCIILNGSSSSLKILKFFKISKDLKKIYTKIKFS